MYESAMQRPIVCVFIWEKRQCGAWLFPCSFKGYCGDSDGRRRGIKLKKRNRERKRTSNPVVVETDCRVPIVFAVGVVTHLSF